MTSAIMNSYEEKLKNIATIESAKNEPAVLKPTIRSKNPTPANSIQPQDLCTMSLNLEYGNN